jgi:hypothetical protein
MGFTIFVTICLSAALWMVWTFFSVEREIRSQRKHSAELMQSAKSVIHAPGFAPGPTLVHSTHVRHGETSMTFPAPRSINRRNYREA